MQWLAEVCVKRPVFAAVLMLLLVVVGIAGYSKLGVDEFPNVDIPIVVVTARLPGSAPQEMESDVADKLAQSVETLVRNSGGNFARTSRASAIIVSCDFERVPTSLNFT